MSIIITKPKTISAKDKIKLAKAGHVVIEAANPDEVRVVEPMDKATGNHVMMAALQAIRGDLHDSSRKNFANNLADRIIKDEQ